MTSPFASSTLADFLIAIISGALTYPAARFVFGEIAANGIILSPRAKRLFAYLISFALVLAALAIASFFGYVQISPDVVFVAFVAAFATSQALHGYFDLPSANDPKAIDPSSTKAS